MYHGTAQTSAAGTDQRCWREQMTRASAEELADAIVDVIQAGARVINLSVALQGLSPRGGRGLQEALDFAMRRGVVVVAAAIVELLVPAASTFCTRNVSGGPLSPGIGHMGRFRPEIIG